jgi:hypothetical protein
MGCRLEGRAAMTVMTTGEKALYHQIHPLKLATDIAAQIASFWLFWIHLLVPGLLVMFVPPVIVSTLMLRFGDFTGQRDSAVGRYIAWEMTPAMQAVRLAGTLPISLGAWLHVWWLAALGLAFVLFGWLRGLFFARA